MTKINFKSVGTTLTEKQRRVEEDIAPSPIGIKTPLQRGWQSDIVSMHVNPASQIRDNFRNLLLTNHGERLGMFDFGANLRSLAMRGAELSEQDFDNEAIRKVSAAVAKYMPFIELDEFESQFIKNSNANTQQIRVRISYDVTALGIFNQAVSVIFHLGNLTKSARGINSSQFETDDVTFANDSEPLPGEPLWLWQANSITGIEDGQPLDTWVDEGSRGEDATETGSLRPTYYMADGPRTGDARVWFDDTNDRLLTAITSFTISQPVIWVAIIRRDAGTGGHIIQDGTQGPQVITSSDGVMRMKSNTAQDSAVGAAPDDTWVWWICEFNGASSYGESSTGITYSSNPGSNSIDDRIHIGTNLAGSNRYGGDIHFLACWNDGTTVDDLRTWLQIEYPDL